MLIRFLDSFMMVITVDDLLLFIRVGAEGGTVEERLSHHERGEPVQREGAESPADTGRFTHVQENHFVLYFEIKNCVKCIV